MDNVPDLTYPSDEVVRNIVDVWHEVKKKATVVLLLDTSGSMAGAKIKAAITGAEVFLDQMGPADEVYVMTFARQVNELPAGGPVGLVREDLKQTLSGLFGDGSTVLYEAMIRALDRIDQLTAGDKARGERRLYGIVLLSDGKNETSGGPSLNDMLRRLPSGTEASGVKIYTIAYGEDADLDVLATLANRTNGKQFNGSVEDIQAVYFLISSEF
jgi:Ca-activated chloride channel family protein